MGLYSVPIYPKTAQKAKSRLPSFFLAEFLARFFAGWAKRFDFDVYEERFWELRTQHFEYLYVGLPALETPGDRTLQGSESHESDGV